MNVPQQRVKYDLDDAERVKSRSGGPHCRFATEFEQHLRRREVVPYQLEHCLNLVSGARCQLGRMHWLWVDRQFAKQQSNLVFKPPPHLGRRRVDLLGAKLKVVISVLLDLIY